MKKNKKTILIVIVILLLSTLLTASIIFGRNIAKKFNEKLNNENEVKEEKKDNENKDEEEPFDFKLKVYSDEMNSNGKHYIIETSSDDLKVELEIEVESEDAKIYDIVTTEDYNIGDLRFVLYKDKTLKLLNVVNNTTEEVGLEYDDYSLQASYDGNEVKGIIYSNKNTGDIQDFYGKEYINYGYYDLVSKKKMYENKYDMIVSSRGDFIEGRIFEESYEEKVKSNLIDTIEYNSYALNINNEQIALMTTEQYWNGPQLLSEKYGNKFYFFQNDGPDTGYESWSSIYSNSGNLIVKEKDDNAWSIDKNGYLFIVEDNKVKKYNIDGKLISSSKEYSKIICNSNKYIFYVKNNELFITDYENTFTKKVIDYNEEMWLMQEKYIEKSDNKRECINLYFDEYLINYDIETKEIEINTYEE